MEFLIKLDKYLAEDPDKKSQVYAVINHMDPKDFCDLIDLGLFFSYKHAIYTCNDQDVKCEDCYSEETEFEQNYRLFDITRNLVDPILEFEESEISTDEDNFYLDSISE